MIDSDAPRDEDREFKMAKAMDDKFEVAQDTQARADRLESLAYAREEGSGGRTDISDDLAEVAQIRAEAIVQKEGMEAAGDAAGRVYDAEQAARVAEAREALVATEFDKDQELNSLEPG